MHFAFARPPCFPVQGPRVGLICSRGRSSRSPAAHCRGTGGVIMGDIRRVGTGPPGKNLFSQVSVHGNTVYLAGQVANTEKFTETAGQTTNILEKIEAHLESVGSDKHHIISIQIWLSDISSAPQMNESYAAFFEDVDSKPVRATVEAKLLRPALLVEMMVVAALPSPAKTISTDQAAAAVGPYSQGIVIEDGTIFASGCIGLDAATGEFVGDGVEEQCRQVLKNLWAILQAGGAKSPSDIVKTTILLDEMADFGKVNEIYKEFFGDGRVPARATFAAKDLPKGAKVEIDAIARVATNE